MCKLRNPVLAALASTLLFGTVAVAQSTSTSAGEPSMSKAGGVQTADRKFMDAAAQGGMAEVELGQLAQQNGQSQEVKDFGKKMVEDHSKANDQLKQLASQKGVTLPSDMDAKDKATKAKLEKLQGAAFDRAYMNDMLTDHKKDVAEFKHESVAAKDPDLKNWAGQTLPTLQDHLKMAEQYAKNGKSEGAKTAKSASDQPTMTAQPH